MAYKPTHAKLSASAKVVAGGAAVVGAAAIAAAASGVIGTGVPASAATAPLGATASACGTGSSASWNTSGDAVLTVGGGAAGECGEPAGQTYNPSYAQLTLDGVKGAFLPNTEPVFSTDHGASGSPRLVIDLGNGHQLIGYSKEALGSSPVDANGMGWATDLSPNSYVDYATAYNQVLAYETTIKDAYVVMDADQVPGTSDTITGFTFAGQEVVREPGLSDGHVVLLNNNRVTVAWKGTGATEWKVTMHTPGPLNNRTAIVHTPQAAYSGLWSGHTGYVNIQPLVDGQPLGSAGHVYFTTTHAK